MPADLGSTLKIKMADIQMDMDVRARKDYGDIDELAASISKLGLINPITVYSATNRPPFTVLAGGRRYLAAKKLGLDEVTCRVYDHILSDYEARAIELHENVYRKDMTDAEKVFLTAELHQLMVQIHGPKMPGKEGGHSLKDTAKMVGKSVGKVHSDIQLAQAMKDFPDLNLDQVENKTTAMRVLKRFASAVQNRMAAEEIKKHGIDVTDDAIAAYRVGNFLEHDLPADSFGFIEIDPPYAIDLQDVRASADKTDLHSHYNEIDKKEYTAFMRRVAEECYRLANNNCWIICWYAPEWYSTICYVFGSAGFTINPVPGIWKKGNTTGQSNSPDSNLGNAYEQFIYMRKGSPKLRQMGRSNIFDFTGVSGLHRIHPTERPRELLREILLTFAWPGTPILVPFAGSGNTLREAQSAGHPCVGYDLSRHFYDSYVGRIVAERKQG